jgi:hypothetical protein
VIQGHRPSWQDLVLISLAAAASGFGADAAAADVNVRTEIYLSGISNYYRDEGDSAGFDTFAVTAEINLYPAGKPFYGGLLVDYRDSTSDRVNDNFNVGGYFRYNFSRWDTTTWLFTNYSPGNKSTWVYATRLRYRMTDTFKLGVEALAPFEHADKPKIMGGLYGSFSKTLSYRVLAGAGINSGPDFASRIELVWQVR